jgi:hypothetical protein
LSRPGLFLMDQHGWCPQSFSFSSFSKSAICSSAVKLLTSRCGSAAELIAAVSGGGAGITWPG